MERVSEGEREREKRDEEGKLYEYNIKRLTCDSYYSSLAFVLLDVWIDV